MPQEGRKVPASHGVTWLRHGIEAVTERPLTWFGLTALFVLVALALNMVPLAGFLWPIAVPMFLGGLMLGCDEERRGIGQVAVRHLFIGCQAPYIQPLALLGLIQFGISLAVTLPLMAIIVIGGVASATLATLSQGLGLIGIVGILVGVLVMAAVSVALTMAMWFAPALVTINRVEPVEAIKVSFAAASRNIGAFLVYMGCMLGAGLLFVLPLAGAIALAAMQGDSPGAMTAIGIGGAVMLVFLGILLMLPVSLAAIYASYRDVFVDEPGTGREPVAVRPV